MDSEFKNFIDFLNKWKEIYENGEQPTDIKIDGLGLFTNAKVTRDNNDDFALTYDEYIKEYKE